MAKSFSKTLRMVLSPRTIQESSKKLYYGALYLNLETSGDKITLCVALQFPSTLNNFVLYSLIVGFGFSEIFTVGMAIYTLIVSL